MGSSLNPLSPVQAELLRQILNDGNQQVGPALQMILAQEPDSLQVKTSMVKFADLEALFGSDPLVTVKIGFEGDIKGEFLFLQPESEAEGLRQALRALCQGDVMAVSNAAEYIRGDWVSANRAEGGVSEQKLQDALGELGNVLFGGYLTAIYSHCAMATFQELPAVKMPDRDQLLFQKALEIYSGQAERVFLAEISCSIGEHPVHFWLVMMAQPAGFHAMLEALERG